MMLLILKYVCMLLAIATTGIQITIVAMSCTFLSVLDPKKYAGLDGKFRFNFGYNWIWFLVGFFWAAFFFLNHFV